jgi:hypothetical protein
MIRPRHDKSSKILRLHQWLTSPTFYEQLLRMQIPKAQKRTSSFFGLMGSAGAKAAHRILMKLTPGVDFINISCTAFMCADPKSAKNRVKSLFGAFWIFMPKSYS